jgi:hypothetical protein
VSPEFMERRITIKLSCTRVRGGVVALDHDVRTICWMCSYCIVIESGKAKMQGRQSIQAALDTNLHVTQPIQRSTTLTTSVMICRREASQRKCACSRQDGNKKKTPPHQAKKRQKINPMRGSNPRPYDTCLPKKIRVVRSTD